MIRINNLKIRVEDDNLLKEKILKKLRIDDLINYKIIKKSIDARDKNNIFYVYEINVLVNEEEKALKKVNDKNVFITTEKDYSYKVTGKKELNNRIVIVGSGPSGLFCGYLLSEAGYKVTILEQGKPIEDRIVDVENFFKTNKLNPLSNVQFGEGGAGTFSDGKLNTLVKDKLNRGKKVFEIFIENGAPDNIMYLNKPHIGTDILRKVIVNIRNKIINMGGEFRFNTKLTDINIINNKVNSIEVNNKEIINCDLLVLAIGHSARDTFYMLYDKGLNMKSKNFAVGLRIEHPKDMINISQYGKYKDILPTASYKLTYQTKDGRGVYSFCMCPGGFVVNASSEEKRLVVNGMSNYNRDEINSNSAIVVTVSNKDFGDNIFSGLEFQRRLEESAYKLGNGLIPVQLFKDYKNNKLSTKFGEVIPNTKGDYILSNLHDLFSKEITNSIIEGIDYFGSKIKGFNRDDAILLGVESRTSSPIIIERNEELISSVEGIYPCGEGAGYAGGITTAAIDGVKVFESIISKYKIN
ncbi:MAG: NAD(P)-binding protein [Bacilli bacterium]|nr:NAD(P)-binding protein [Bacilli bacterium]